MHQQRLYADYTTLGLGSLRSHLSNSVFSRIRPRSPSHRFLPDKIRYQRWSFAEKAVCGMSLC